MSDHDVLSMPKVRFDPGVMKSHREDERESLVERIRNNSVTPSYLFVPVTTVWN